MRCVRRNVQRQRGLFVFFKLYFSDYKSVFLIYLSSSFVKTFKVQSWGSLRSMRCVRRNVQRQRGLFAYFVNCISQIIKSVFLICLSYSFVKTFKVQSRSSLRGMRCVRRNVQRQRGLFVPFAREHHWQSREAIGTTVVFSQ